MRTQIQACLLIFFTSFPIQGFCAAVAEDCAKLFNRVEVIEFELVSDFKKIADEREFNSQQALEMGYTEKQLFTNGIIKEISAGDSKAYPVEVRARGNSSSDASESEFPKLKVQFEKGTTLTESPFEKVKSFRINTHVSTSPKKKWTTWGRHNNEDAPWREGLAYELARTLDFPTPGTRQARITYVDAKTQEIFTRKALLIETDSSIEKRWKAKLVDSFSHGDSETSKIDPIEGAKFHLFHKLIGNADYALRVNEESVVGTELYFAARNTTVFEKDGRRFPLIYDLDLATITRRLDDGVAYPEFGIKGGAVSSFFELSARLFAHFPKEDLRTAAVFFKSKKELLYKVVATYAVDEPGRKLAKKHLDLFFQNIDGVLDLQVLASADIQFFRDTKTMVNKLPMNGITEEPGTLRLGTPIKVIGQEGDFLKVAIIDPYGDLRYGESPVGYIPASSQIAQSLSPSQVRTVDMREIVPSARGED